MGNEEQTRLVNVDSEPKPNGMGKLIASERLDRSEPSL